LVAIASVSGYYFMPETVGAAGEAIFMSALGQKLMRLFMNKAPRLFLTGALAGIGYLPKQQRKEYVDYILKMPGRYDFMRGIMDTMYPYSVRMAGNRNDMEQFRTMKPLPLDKIVSPSLIVHGTLDADVKFFDGVRAYEHIKGAERYWIEGGDHLAFWLSPEAEKAQKFALAFLKRYAGK
jgi:pimeloyl-ACP methyl ester carboxylesterase